MSDLKQISLRLSELESKCGQLTAVMDEIIAKNLPINALLDMAIEPRIYRPTTFSIIFDHTCVVRNSYEADIWEGKVFKWLGPDKLTTVPIPFERSSACSIIIRIPFVVLGLDLGTDCNILVDGQSVSKRVSPTDHGFEINIKVPKSSNDIILPIFLLSIDCARAITLSEQDARLSTLAISEIILTNENVTI